MNPVTQTTLDNEQRLNRIFQQLVVRATDLTTGQVSLSFTVSGVDRVGNGASTFGSQLFFRYVPSIGGARADVKMNLTKFVDTGSGPSKVYEAVGDGKTFWLYNGPSLTYSATPYDLSSNSNPPTQSASYLRDALFALNQASGGNDGASYATRLLRELCAGTSATYHSWAPGYNLVEQSSAYLDPFTGLYRDPATGQETKTQPSTKVDDYDVVYLVYGTPKRAIAFELFRDSNKDAADPDYETIHNIYVTDASTLHGKQRFVTWSLVPGIPLSFDAANFAPYSASQIKGYRPVVAPGPIRS